LLSLVREDDMSHGRCGLLLAVLALASAPSRAGSRPRPNTEAGANLNGVFFPYSVEGLALETVKKKEPEGHRWRTLGAIAGGASAFFAYGPVALSESRIGVSDAQRLAEWSAVTAGTAFLGYWIGKKLDRR
jgi:hypothetical protein